MEKRVLSTFLIFAIIEAFAQQPMKTVQPNIILFLVDDMGWMDTSQPFGDSTMELNRLYHTPNIEQLAKEGMLFTNAYVNNVCTPTRTSLLTGVSSARTHITNWTHPMSNKATDAKDSLLEAPPWNINGISPIVTKNAYSIKEPLPQLLKEAGYHTIHIGKAHWGSQGTPGSDPLNLGFVTNVGGSAIGHPQSYFGEKNFGNEADKITFNAVPGLYEFYNQDIFLTEALTVKSKQLMENAIITKRPFFLYFGHYAVHTPIQADDRFVKRYYEAGLDSIEAAYASLVEGVDKSLGDIMHYLKEKQIEENTIIIFMSDNGGLSNHQRGGERNTHNLPLRAGKGSLYEGGIRVPMIIKWPRVTKPGSRTNQYVMAEDFFPTVIQMAGIKDAGKNILRDGISYVPVLKDASVVDTSRTLIFHYPNRWTANEDEAMSWSSAIRRGSWKLVYLMKQQKLELYNLKNDIGEKNDLAKTHSKKVKELAKLLTDELKNRGAQMPLWKSTRKAVSWPDELLN